MPWFWPRSPSRCPAAIKPRFRPRPRRPRPARPHRSASPPPRARAPRPPLTAPARPKKPPPSPPPPPARRSVRSRPRWAIRPNRASGCARRWSKKSARAW
ncbi:hypothetical protein EG244_03995 [Falsigemmobacter faecalis]|uniref:Uncharacterized protein n=1 Tax=Falsigemmobacter faecalis TaxID=2488730 RepID=A0A3P3DSW1_9RHOB|nr:hypothetical protein EG244_03995 [Falsigemmobacter faecalis]